MDGFPMSKKGEAARALSAAFVSSMYGGIFGALVLSVAVFYAIPLILAMGFSEQLMLIVLALTMIGMLTGDNAWKGLFACVMGFLIKIIGPAPMTAELRLDFLDLDTGYFLDNTKLVIVGLGMFAMPEIIPNFCADSSQFLTPVISGRRAVGFKVLKIGEKTGGCRRDVAS